METIKTGAISVINPNTLEKLYEINETDQAAIDLVFNKARAAQSLILEMSVSQRVNEILKIRDYIIDNRETILNQLILETGKARLDGLTSEVFEIIDFIDVYRKLSLKVLRNKNVPTPLVLMGKKSEIWLEPLGTILVITPWNYPLYQTLIPSMSAFLAGNAVIVKPSEITPLKVLLQEIIDKSGFLKNAIQFVHGSGETAIRLIDSGPNKIHFTGSCKTGKKIMMQAANHLIPVDLELGGKDAAIVFEDINLERTVNGIMWGGYTSAGQSCTSVERCYVHESIFEKFVELLVDRSKKLKTSFPDRKIEDADSCDLGCITTEFQVKIIEAQIKDAVEKGAKILCGGKREGNTRSFHPTVIVDVNHSMKIMIDETFGPVIPVMKFKTEEEVIKLANDSEYGLGGSVWSKDISRARRVASKIKTGNLSINNHMLNEGNPNLPFGGTKNSGFGRYKGEDGLLTFCISKSVLIDKDSSNIDPNWYPFTKTKYFLLGQIIDHLFSRKKNWLKFILAGMKMDSIGKKEKLN